ncbi:MAG: PDZ domain-containing protein [Acidimicrobiales bacterium]|nr:PDZ domain-containing protein [Acidimicrobiales bacterium]
MDGEQPPRHRGRAWSWWLAGSALVGLIAAVILAFIIEIPYYEFRPGSARPIAPLVQVEDTESFPPDSNIAYTTVSLQQSTIASYITAQFDDDVEVVGEQVVLGDRSPTENRQYNLQLMDTSKQDAIRIALQTLGYDVPIAVDGNVVVQVQEGSAADGVLEVGDTIVAIDGEPIEFNEDVSRIMDPKSPGETVTLEVEAPERTGTEEVDITLQPPDEDAVEQGADPERGFIGVSLQPREPDYQYPFPVDIDSGNVGGPSAGLAFSLAVIDVLTPQELTGGLDVAVTGTIRPDGTVGPVGGVAQKTAVVVDEGYDVFIVPRDEAGQIRAHAGDRVDVVPVETLDEALDALSSLGGSGFETAAAPG